MAQNINNVQYINMANPGVGHDPPPGQTYQLPQNSLSGLISTRRSNPGSISTTLQNANMGIGENANKDMYSAWRDLVKDLMIARNYVLGAMAAIYHDADFQPIVAGIRRLSPECDGLATASAVGNVARMQDVDEAVVYLVKDCVVKLFNTIKTQGPAALQGQPEVPFALVMVPGIFLSTNIPAQWGLATALPNVAPVPQNAPQGNAPPALPGNNQAPAPPPPPPPPPGNNQVPARLLRLSPSPPPKRNQAQPPIIPPDQLLTLLHLGTTKCSHQSYLLDHCQLLTLPLYYILTLRHQLITLRHQLITLRHQLTSPGYQLTILHYQLTILRSSLLILRYQLRHYSSANRTASTSKSPDGQLYANRLVLF